MRTIALLLFTISAVLQAQVCETPRPDLHPTGMVYQAAVIDEYKKLLQENPGSAEYLYLYGRVLTGTHTPEAISYLNQALQADPSYAPAHLKLVEIFRAPAFLDAAKTQAHLEAWMKACPAQFDGFVYLERMPDSEFVRAHATRMRSLIDQANDRIALRNFRTLWTLEFQVHAPPEYPQVKEQIGKDLMRLRAMDLKQNPTLATTLREGYKMVADKNGLAWVEANAPSKPESHGGSGVMEALQEWQTAHPFPTSKSNPADSQKAFQERNKALLAATAEWTEKWPNDEFAWVQRLQALSSYRDVSDADVELAAEKAVKAYQSGNRTGTPPQFQIASLYLQRNMHVKELPEMVKKALAELDEAPGSAGMTSDLYPRNGPVSMRTANKLNGLGTLVEIYFKDSQLGSVREALASVRAELDANKPKDGASTMEKRQWSSYDGQYWDKKARFDENEGHKVDALSDYENEIRGGAMQGATSYIRQKAKHLWTDLGGTAEGWENWGLTTDAPKLVSKTIDSGNWEQMNKALPEFTITDMAGKTWTLADLKGKTTLVNLWATWCAPCVKELPELQKLYDQVKDRPDIRIITLNTDDNAGLIEPFLKDKHYTFPVLPARALVAELVPSLSIPRNWLVDSQAILKLETIGFGSANGKWTDQMKEKMENLANSK